MSLSDRTLWQKALICAVGQECDWTDKSHLEPLLKYRRIKQIVRATSPSSSKPAYAKSTQVRDVASSKA